MRVDESKTAEPLAPLAIGAQIGEEKRASVAHHRFSDMPAPVDEKAHLPINLSGDFGQGAREIGRDR